MNRRISPNGINQIRDTPPPQMPERITPVIQDNNGLILGDNSEEFNQRFVNNMYHPPNRHHSPLSPMTPPHNLSPPTPPDTPHGFVPPPPRLTRNNGVPNHGQHHGINHHLQNNGAHNLIDLITEVELETQAFLQAALNNVQNGHDQIGGRSKRKKSKGKNKSKRNSKMSSNLLDLCNSNNNLAKQLALLTSRTHKKTRRRSF